MKIVYMTREYPPYVYGGAGVHVEYLVREMVRLASVEVKCFGDQKFKTHNLSVQGYPFCEDFFKDNSEKVKQSLMVLLTCMRFNATPVVADVVHCHTWYAAWAGILSKICYGTPLVITVHSLEPSRPWKREQLGRGYDMSLWIEKTALEMADIVIAVSTTSREEIISYFDIKPERIRVIPNGVDASQFKPVRARTALAKYGVNPQIPYVLFLGRITRQKGIIHFINAIRYLDPQIQAVLCAGAPDTPEIAKEIEASVAEIRKVRENVIWIHKMVTRQESIELYSHAAVFCCPSIYEPFGLINLEAMACETPVVASAVGGINEVVVPGETGELVPFESISSKNPEPARPEEFARSLAQAMNRLMADKGLRLKMGKQGRKRVRDNFAWDKVAFKLMEVYKEVVHR
ncbi:MAG: glycosyl transferase family 1 [Nitrospira bacterium SG8_3]|nr:MAG: glycosyl transferase family 1 [Nitrospira bacterium SG8_3]